MLTLNTHKDLIALDFFFGLVVLVAIFFTFFLSIQFLFIILVFFILLLLQSDDLFLVLDGLFKELLRFLFIAFQDLGRFGAILLSKCF